MHYGKCGGGVFLSQFALAGSLLASEHFHLVLSGYAKLSHIFSNLVFMTSSLNFLLHRELDKVYNRREEYSYSYMLSRSLLFSALFIEIIYHFPQNPVRSLRGCRKSGKPLEKV